MTKKKILRIRPAVRDGILENLDKVASLLEEKGYHRDDAGDLIEEAVGELVEIALEAVGVPDLAADWLGEKVEALIHSLKPTREDLLARAVEAANKGNADKAQRLIAKASRRSE